MKYQPWNLISDRLTELAETVSAGASDIEDRLEHIEDVLGQLDTSLKLITRAALAMLAPESRRQALEGTPHEVDREGFPVMHMADGTEIGGFPPKPRFSRF
jgi:hypothetical protein